MGQDEVSRRNAISEADGKVEYVDKDGEHTKGVKRKRRVASELK